MEITKKETRNGKTFYSVTIDEGRVNTNFRPYIAKLAATEKVEYGWKVSREFVSDLERISPAYSNMTADFEIEEGGFFEVKDGSGKYKLSEYYRIENGEIVTVDVDDPKDERETKKQIEKMIHATKEEETKEEETEKETEKETYC